MEELIIKQGENLVSTYYNDEGKEKVVSIGNCPVCNKVISFELDIVNKSRAEELVGSLYQYFLENHEVCFNCRVLFEAWCREHKELCDRKHITYRDVGNKLLEKQGKEPIIGTNKGLLEGIEEELEGDNDEEVPEEGTLLPNLTGHNQVNRTDNERRLIQNE